MRLAGRGGRLPMPFDVVHAGEVSYTPAPGLRP
jgi:hypothetical protein